MALLLAPLAVGPLAVGPRAASAAGEAVRWVEVFADPGRSGDVGERWRVWGEPANHQISRGPDGMRVRGGPDVGDDSHRVMLWALAEVPGPDVRVTFDYTRHDSTSPGRGIASMLFLSCAGVPPAVSADPTLTSVAAPSLDFVNSELDGVRLSYSTDYNPSPAVRAQLRLHLVPGNRDVPPDSPRDFPFTPGVTYRLDWEKVGDRVRVTVAPMNGGPVLEHVWQDPGIAGKRGPRVGLYQQPYRDATYADIHIYRRAE